METDYYCFALIMFFTVSAALLKPQKLKRVLFVKAHNMVSKCLDAEYTLLKMSVAAVWHGKWMFVVTSTQFGCLMSFVVHI